MKLFFCISVPLLFWAGVWLLASGRLPGGSIRHSFSFAKMRRLLGRDAAGRLVQKGGCLAKSTPVYRKLLRIRSARNRDRSVQALSECLAYIRNIAILGRADMLSAETVLTELCEFSPRLRNVFSDMLSAIRLGDKARASEALYAATGESCARDIGSFLAGWDDIPPKELLQSIELYRSTLLEARYTRLRRRDELISDLVYFPVVLNCMVVLLNFLYVAYFLQQKEILSLFF